jgi:hypothetical protein
LVDFQGNEVVRDPIVFGTLFVMRQSVAHL